MTAPLPMIRFEEDEPYFPEPDTGVARKLAFYGNTLCPVRKELRQRLHHTFSQRFPKEAPPAWYMPAACRGPSVYADLWRWSDPDSMPEVIAETGPGNFMRPEFIARCVDSGTFGALPNIDVRPEFIEAGLRDPLGVYHIYGAYPYVILADLERLQGRPAPRAWDDLLHPRFARDVILGGWHGHVSRMPLLHIHRFFGDDGIKNLAQNIKALWHEAQMVKAICARNLDGAALYILPWFFAASCPRREGVRLIWPEDGAIFLPHFVMRKPALGEAAQHAWDFLLGEDWARFLDSYRYVPARPLSGASPLPGRLNWLGWDFVRTHDPEALYQRLSASIIESCGEQ